MWSTNWLIFWSSPLEFDGSLVANHSLIFFVYLRWLLFFFSFICLFVLLHYKMIKRMPKNTEHYWMILLHACFFRKTPLDIPVYCISIAKYILIGFSADTWGVLFYDIVTSNPFNHAVYSIIWTGRAVYTCIKIITSYVKETLSTYFFLYDLQIVKIHFSTPPLF